MPIVSPATKCIKSEPQPSSYPSQIMWLQQQIDGLPEFTMETTGFTMDQTEWTMDKVLA